MGDDESRGGRDGPGCDAALTGSEDSLPEVVLVNLPGSAAEDADGSVASLLSLLPRVRARLLPSETAELKQANARNSKVQARHGKAGKSRQDKGKTTQEASKDRQGKGKGKVRCRHGEGRHGKARQGMASRAEQDKAREGKARQGRARQSEASKAGQRKARQGKGG